MISYTTYNKLELGQLISSAKFIDLRTLPITTHRAVSHINNPRACDDDILLIVAWSECEVVGYIGIVPDRLFSSDGKSVKCGCASCFWVDGDLRGKGVGDQLLKMAIAHSDARVYLTDFVPNTKKIYYKTGEFAPPLSVSGIKLYMRFELHKILPPRNRFFKKMKGLLRVGDTLLNSFLDVRFLFFKNENAKRNIQYVNQIDEETDVFISKFQHNQLFKRGKAELNWIINYPWIRSSPTKNSESQRYYFSSVDKSFEYFGLKLRNSKNELVAFLLFSKRNQTLKLLYCYFEESIAEDIAAIIIDLIVKWRINSFTTFNAGLVHYFSKNKTRAIFKKLIERQYLMTNSLDENIDKEKFEIQDGDADCAFT